MKSKLSTLAASAAVAFSLQAEPVAAQQFYLGEIIIGGWNFCPRATAKADGQLIAISSNEALFSLYGTMYGGDGRTTFGLPDLRGRIAMHSGNGPGLTPVREGEKGGHETITQNITTLANHTHTIATTSELRGSAGTLNATDLAGAALGNQAAATYTTRGSVDQAAKDGSVVVTSTALNTGGNLSMNIRNPYQGVMFCIVTQGTFPSRN